MFYSGVLFTDQFVWQGKKVTYWLINCSNVLILVENNGALIYYANDVNDSLFTAVVVIEAREPSMAWEQRARQLTSFPSGILSHGLVSLEDVTYPTALKYFFVSRVTRVFKLMKRAL